MSTRVEIDDIIVVEGLHDKQAVESAVKADVWVIGGDRIAHTFLAELKRLSQHRQVIVFTDPDTPGERIRQRVEKAIPNCKHAFLAKNAARSSHGIGVEHADRDAIVAALMAARPVMGRLRESESVFCAEDLVSAGLAGTRDAAERRAFVGQILNIGYSNSKRFLYKLNTLGVTRAEWERAVAELEKRKDSQHD